MKKVTKKDAYPLPNMDSILDKLRAKFLPKIDLKAAHHQIQMARESKKYTAFAVPARDSGNIQECPLNSLSFNIKQ